jgi:hypothetical protein
MRNPRSILALAGIVAWACGGGGGEADPSESVDAVAPAVAQAMPPVDPASIPADRAGTFELHGAEYTFLVVQCDLTGGTTSGIVLRGNGTTPDGRRITVEVERLYSDTVVSERATLIFGSIVDGDHWTADGPLLRISDNELTAEGTYRNDRDDSTTIGTLRAVCPS